MTFRKMVDSEFNILFVGLGSRHCAIPTYIMLNPNVVKLSGSRLGQLVRDTNLGKSSKEYLPFLHESKGLLFQAGTFVNSKGIFFDGLADYLFRSALLVYSP